MALQILYSAGAFGPGSDLWITPELSTSIWTRKIDWYLNLLITRSKLYQPKQLAETICKIINENQIEQPLTRNLQNAPLLISTQNRLPSRYVLELPKLDDFSEWLSLAKKNWLELGQPHARFFLPPGTNTNDFQQCWGEFEAEIQFTLIAATSQTEHGEH